ncbi:hypothetical protein H0X48_03185 [Candidatus Dependentiae bacterium]|nr:hypothetical protein [Candidatus Dependentiae bacterium]
MANKHNRLSSLIYFSLPSVILSSIFWGFSMQLSNNYNTPISGTIIILNGPSASGKSSLQKKLQELYAELYLKVGIDDLFVNLLPARYITSPVPHQTPETMVMKGTSSKDSEGNPVFSLEIGTLGQKAIAGMHAAIGAYARAGNNVIVDYILYYPEWTAQLVHNLRGLRVYMIGIKPTLSAIEQREKSRGTTPLGHARSHYATVHQGMIYDLELDTTAMTVEQAALKVQEFIKNNSEPKAFKALSEKAA